MHSRHVGRVLVRLQVGASSPRSIPVSGSPPVPTSSAKTLPPRHGIHMPCYWSFAAHSPMVGRDWKLPVLVQCSGAPAQTRPTHTDRSLCLVQCLVTVWHVQV